MLIKGYGGVKNGIFIDWTFSWNILKTVSSRTNYSIKKSVYIKLLTEIVLLIFYLSIKGYGGVKNGIIINWTLIWDISKTISSRTNYSIQKFSYIKLQTEIVLLIFCLFIKWYGCVKNCIISPVSIEYFPKISRKLSVLERTILYKN